LRTPGRAAAALALGRIHAAVDRDTVVRETTQWSLSAYAPALAEVATLSDAERDQIVASLSKLTTFPAAAIDRKTLAITPRQFLTGLLKDEGKTLDTFDMRRTSEPREDPAAIDGYLRGELGYHTNLAYAGLGLNPGNEKDVPSSETINANWHYDSGVITPE